MNTKKGNYLFVYVVGFSIIVSLLFLAICSKSSFLYPFNDWVDANAFFTVGKGMFHGKVPYKDLVDTKGPLLYFIYAIGYSFSHTTFLGIYILEVLSFTIVLIYFYKILCLYIDKIYFFLLAPILACTLLSNRSFSYGGSAEEFCLPLFFISFFYLLKSFKTEFQLPSKFCIAFNGSIAGCILWIKFTLLGFWANWIFFIILSCLLRKEYKFALKIYFTFLLGMFITTIPWIVYFLITGGFKEWIDIYIVKNIFTYSKTNSSIIYTLMSIYFDYSINSLQNFLPFALMVVGVFLFSFSDKYFYNVLGKFSLIFSLISVVIGIYIGGVSFPYYYLPCTIFSIIGLISLTNINHHKFFLYFKKYKGLLTCILTATFLISSYYLSGNTSTIGISPKEMVQYKFATIINKTPNATLLNYNFLDGGFYTAAHIMPSGKYFHKPNFSHDEFPDIMDEQNEFIHNRYIDFIIIREDSNIPPILIGYQEIAHQDQYFDSSCYTYYLFQKLE